MRTALYRHFDGAGVLLYVGVSLSAVQRLAQHRQTAHWFEQIARVTIEWLPTRQRALEAETWAIANEGPVHNVRRPGPKLLPLWRPQPTQSIPGWAMLHPASGRMDGNYFFDDDVRDMLEWWQSTFPREQFELVLGTRARTLALRVHNASEWRAAA